MLSPIIEVDTTVPPANIFQLCDLDSSATYFVSVRALCDISKKSTDWTDPVYFRLTNPQNGIDTPESALGATPSSPQTRPVTVSSPARTSSSPGSTPTTPAAPSSTASPPAA